MFISIKRNELCQPDKRVIKADDNGLTDHPEIDYIWPAIFVDRSISVEMSRMSIMTYIPLGYQHNV
jgi:hypothetical protein